ncbi:cation diffusion facilitator family transporter [Sediminispirochaeta smaragdinae]|jgi:cation diffusion facilitator family transporter|uniref:Cation diffusion facilitator family transporter n=1 Tax=Sediminispirochaeta smaragdinae (strain DSM 11293 / JCM 15392 / SEBR 4228) TaxID=573413 RepID=E1RA78_SEDSS|nr:cation diffusion facilitator family transporter [Sediminispirochaeta smaragdinae]ADK79369.1 cation diffusion facilitator family transporter [Sediminispirochaeta smaragdinae DSM 11293]
MKEKGRKPSDFRIRMIRRASWVGILGNGLLSALKVTVGFFSGSLALVGDGIDSATDVVTSFVSLLTAGIVERPPDNEHPYGHARAETVATKILGFLIFFAGAQLALSTLRSLFSGVSRPLPEFPAAMVALVSVVGKSLLAFYKLRVGRTIDSPMLIADARNMTGDVVISLGVFAGIGATLLSGIAFLDSIIALLVSLWIMKVAFSIFMEAGDELMDGLDNPDLYRRLFDAVGTVKGAGNPHKARIRKLGNACIVDLDIEVDGAISVAEGHEIAREVERAIHLQLKNVYDVQVHVEPLGNLEKKERFGLSRQSLETSGK